MPAFYILVILGLIVFWFLASFLFKPFGKLGYRIWKDAKDAIEEEDIEKSE